MAYTITYTFMIEKIKISAHKLLRKSEKYTKTDMVYLASGSFWLNSNMLISSVLGFVLSVFFANLLPKETYGVYQYILAVSTIIGGFCLTGMNNAITRSVSRGFEGSLKESIRTQLKWSLIPFSIAILWAVKSVLEGNIQLFFGLCIIAVATPLINTFNTYNAFLHGRKMFSAAFRYNLISNLFYYATIFLGVFLLKDGIALAAINLITNALAAMFFYHLIIKKYKPNDQEEPDTIEYGKHMSFLNIFSIIAAQIDNIFVFSILGPVQLALYSIASIVPERIGGFAKNLYLISIPKFSERTHKEIKSTINTKILYLTAFSAVICILYVIGSPFLFKFFFPQYKEAIFYTQIYSLILLFSAGQITTSILISQQKKKELYVLTIISPVFQTILQLVLVIKFGLVGIIGAKILSSFTSLTLSTFFVTRNK